MGHIGNGYYILKSHSGRLISVTDHGHIKLAKLKNPVKQKCMFYREQIGQQCRFRSVNGHFITLKPNGTMEGEKNPSTNSLFYLELVPIAPAPSAPSIPAPPQNVRSSDISSQPNSPQSYAQPQGYNQQPSYYNQPSYGQPQDYSRSGPENPPSYAQAAPQQTPSYLQGIQSNTSTPNPYSYQ